MPTIKQLLQIATEELQKREIADARRNASLLLMDLLKCNQTYLLAHDRDFVSEEINAQYQTMIERRSKGEPIQYITSHEEFYGRDFIVNSDVLIPRPETELIIEFVLNQVKAQKLKKPNILDVGTGSGAIAVTLAAELPDANITAIDISPKALKVAQENAKIHQVNNRISWFCSDLVEKLDLSKQFHFCCANLPYIDPDERSTLMREVRDYEPELALFAPENGLLLIKRLINEVIPFIYLNGYLICEIGFGQEEALLKEVDYKFWQAEKTIKDLQGIARTIVLRKIEKSDNS